MKRKPARMTIQRRVGNLEKAFVVHDRRWLALAKRIAKIETRLKRNEGKTAIGFMHEED